MQLNRESILKIVFLLVIFLPAVGGAQMTRQDSLWQPFKAFIGSWTGKGGGEPGFGDYERSYKFIFNKRFIEIRNKSMYSPTKNNPKGEVHEDLGYFSYDKTRRTFVLRQFHTEGFVNQYKMDSISENGKRIIFSTEAIENIPAGWRARESYDILDENQIQETFELAAVGKDFEPYTKVVLKRVK
ncbi:MAG: DUF1794 domain-containing protein [Ignavibacteriae bacterium]|nr:MAG: DUF1794 domain-containing protein [Ignavibacteriota bacterium]